MLRMLTKLCVPSLIFVLLLSPSKAFSETGVWRYNSYIDPLDDSRRSIASTSWSYELIPSGPYSLYVQCENGDLNVIVNFDKYLGNDARPITYRFDKTSPIKTEWLPSTVGTALFARRPVWFAHALSTGNQVILEATDSRGVRQRTGFYLKGSRQAIEPVLRDCGFATIKYELEYIISRLQGKFRPPQELK